MRPSGTPRHESSARSSWRSSRRPGSTGSRRLRRERRSRRRRRERRGCAGRTNAPSSSAPATCDGEARQGGRLRAARAIASQLPVYLSSALDGPVGIAAAAHAAQALRRRGDAGIAHGLATQRLFAEIDRRRRVRAARRHAPSCRRARGSESRSTRTRSPATRALSSAAYASADGPDQPQHRARLGPGRGAGAAAGCATRSSAPARARPRWRSRFGASRRSRLSVIVDERSAGFFALGAAQATGTPVAVLCTSGTAAANLHPAVCEADESGVPLIVADRRPAARAAGDRRRADDRPAEALRRRGPLVLRGRQPRGRRCRAAALPLGRLPRLRRRPRRSAAGPGPPESRLAGAAGADRAAGAVTATDPLALEGRDERPLTAVATGPPAPDDFTIGELSRHLGNAKRALIIAGRQRDSGLREPLASLARAAGDADPRRADLAASLRPARPLSRRLGLRLRSCAPGPPRADPDLVLRFGEMPTSKPLREWLAGLGG